METSVRLKVSELDESFIQTIREMFKKDREITLTISSATDFDLNVTESKEDYIIRLKRAVQNLNDGKGITYTEDGLDEFVMEYLKR